MSVISVLNHHPAQPVKFVHLGGFPQEFGHSSYRPLAIFNSMIRAGRNQFPVSCWFDLCNSHKDLVGNTRQPLTQYMTTPAWDEWPAVFKCILFNLACAVQVHHAMLPAM